MAFVRLGQHFQPRRPSHQPALALLCLAPPLVLPLPPPYLQIMERTGHRSLEGVRSYKRTSEQQRQALSDILNHGSKTNAAPQETSSSSSTHLLPALVERGSTSCAFTSQQQLRSLSLTGSTFQGCTVNFYVGPKATTTRKRRRPMVIDDDSSDSD